MMPTAEDFEPRRDGWFEHKGTWDEVTVGTILADKDRRSKWWEVIATSHGDQVQYGYTLWFRVRDETGAEATIAPKLKSLQARILTRSPLDKKGLPPSEPSDTAAIQLVIEQLGAVRLATRNDITGEITCPDYIFDPGHADGDRRRGLIEHMRFAHGMTVDGTLTTEEAIPLHGHAHDPKWVDVGKSGFPHRHLPEDLSFL